MVKPDTFHLNVPVTKTKIRKRTVVFLKQIIHINQMYREGVRVADIAQIMNVSKQTIYRNLDQDDTTH